MCWNCVHEISKIVVRDWSLMTGRGGATKRGGGGSSEVLPLRKGGGATNAYLLHVSVIRL